MRITEIFMSLGSAVLAAAGLAVSSCEPEGLTDESFSLYYAGVTDIGPSTDFSLTPTWHGPAPSDFKVTGVSLDGADCETGCFTVDSETGVFSIRGTGNLPTGIYTIGISCVSDGKTHNFPEAVTVNMMKAIPDGITVEPSVVQVTLADVRSSDAELPTAQISTDGNHISIKKYIIANVHRDGMLLDKFDDLFQVSSSGEVSITGGNAGFVPGKYVLDFKLTTFVYGEDSSEGLFENALEINVTSAPLELTYTPAASKAETGVAFTSAVPVLVGSTDDLKYSIRGTSPETSEVTIDGTTGTLSLPEGHTLEAGTEIAVSVTAENKYGSSDFDNAYTISVVAYVTPISGFSYPDKDDIIYGVKFSQSPVLEAGDDVTYAFVELPEALSELIIDENTGVISAKKGNTIAVGQHKVTVRATNMKGSQDAVFCFTVLDNPNNFTYFRYGNNLGLTPIEDYADQFRIESDQTFPVTFELAESDIPSGRPVKFSLKNRFCNHDATIDASTGAITLAKASARTMNFITVTAAVGEGDAAIEMTIPVFFHTNSVINKSYKVTYTPFVFRCNPKTGGASVSPSVNGGTPPSGFAMDYRRNFNYYNLDGPDSHADGQPAAKGFMYTLWSTYFTGVGKSVNTGSRDPMSWFSGDASLRLGYVRQSDFAVVINPEKWRDDSGYANGVMIGQITLGETGGADPSGQAGGFPVAIWFDQKFSNE